MKDMFPLDDDRFFRTRNVSYFWFMLSIFKTNFAISEIKEYTEYLYWENITKYHMLSIDFIDTFKDKVCWDIISMDDHYLTDEFVEKFMYKIDWSEIFYCEKDIKLKYLIRFIVEYICRPDKFDRVNELNIIVILAYIYDKYRNAFRTILYTIILIHVYLFE